MKKSQTKRIAIQSKVKKHKLNIDHSKNEVSFLTNTVEKIRLFLIKELSKLEKKIKNQMKKELKEKK